MYAVTGSSIQPATIAALEQRHYVQVMQGDTLELTDAGREVAIRTLAAAKSAEAHLMEQLGVHEEATLKNLLRKVIQLTDPGLPDMWGRTP